MTHRRGRYGRHGGFLGRGSCLCKSMRSGEAGAGCWDHGQLFVAGMSENEGRSRDTVDRWANS